MGKFRVMVKGIVEFHGKLLAVERWYNDCIVEPYQWEFLDGDMEPDETPTEAVERVVADLTGIGVSEIRPVYTWGFTAGEVPVVGIAFLCQAGTEAVLLSEEISDFKWITREEVPEVVTRNAIIRDMRAAGLIPQED